MGDNKIAGSPSAQLHCPSGENRFADVVQKIKVDNQLSKKEISAAIACQYGAYLPPAIGSNGKPMSIKEMEKAGFIGGLSKKLESIDEETAIIFYRRYALGEKDTSTPPDPKITRQMVVSHFEKLEAERIEHIQRRDLTETAMFFTDTRTITPEVPPSRKTIVNAISPTIGPDAYGVTWAHDGSALVLNGPFYNGHNMMHEALHQHAHHNMQQLPDALNEGMAQYFTLDVLKKSGNLHGYVSALDTPYLPQVSAVYKLRGIVGEEVLKNAFFKGDIDGLKTAVESKIGEGSWREFVGILGRNPSFTSRETVDIDLFFGKKPELLKSAYNSEREFMETLVEIMMFDPIRGKVE